MGETPQISVVISVYNARATIEEVLLRGQEVDLGKEIIIVDDGSTGGTREVLAEVARNADQGRGEILFPRVCKGLPTDTIRVFFQARNCGKGAALRKGFAEARGQVVIIQDADPERGSISKRIDLGSSRRSLSGLQRIDGVCTRSRFHITDVLTPKEKR